MSYGVGLVWGFPCVSLTLPVKRSWNIRSSSTCISDSAVATASEEDKRNSWMMDGEQLWSIIERYHQDEIKEAEKKVIFVVTAVFKHLFYR